MTPTNIVRLISVILIALSLGAGLAHLFALPNKIDLSREEYLIVQQIYRGWALLGIAVVGALLSTLVLAVLSREDRLQFYFTITAAVCIGLSLLIFFTFTYPANQQTFNWTTLPDNWERLRLRWEYSHAVSAVLYLIALVAVTLSSMWPEDRRVYRQGEPARDG